MGTALLGASSTEMMQDFPLHVSKRHIKRLVKSLVCERRLLRVDKRVLWPGILGARRTLANHFWDSEKIYERRCFRSAERM